MKINVNEIREIYYQEGNFQERYETVINIISTEASKGKKYVVIHDNDLAEDIKQLLTEEGFVLGYLQNMDPKGYGVVSWISLDEDDYTQIKCEIEDLLLQDNKTEIND